MFSRGASNKINQDSAFDKKDYQNNNNNFRKHPSKVISYKNRQFDYKESKKIKFQPEEIINPIHRIDTIACDDEPSDNFINNSASDQTSILKNSIIQIEEVENKETDSLPKKNSKRGKTKFGEYSKYIFLPKSKNLDLGCTNNLIETKQTEFLIDKYKYNCTMQCIVSLISISTVIIEYEISFKNNSSDGISQTSNNYPVESPNKDFLNSINYFALWVSFLSSVLLWGLIIYDYLINCKIMHYNKQISESLWRLEKENLTNLILKLIIFFIHPNPLFKDIKMPYYNAKFEVTIYYSLNSIFGLLSLIRLLFFIKYFLVQSVYYSARLQRICVINNFESNLKFTLKANMTKSPVTLYVTLLTIILIFCTFGLRIFERELDALSTQEFASYLNTFWCLIITMFTVGYGDYYPSTLFGRTIGILCCLWGVLLISMLILTIHNILNFDESEKTAFLLLQRISLAGDKDLLAAKLLSRYIKLMKYLKNKEKDERARDKLRDEVVLTKLHFKEKCDEINYTYPPYSNYDNILDELGHLEGSLDELTNVYNKLQSEL